MLDPIQLACILASYEIDEPHVSTPDFDAGPEEEQYYPEITPEEMQKWLKTEHCKNDSCTRCRADAWLHKAEFIIGRLTAQSEGQ